jgi:hypothetical protein
MWSALPVVLSFSALLNARTALSERKSDLTVLNLARTKKGQVPLLDHVEITLRLAGGSGEARRHGGGGSERRVPRLHIVRGHQFRRAGAVYWRASHFRGSGIEVPVTTVSVKGANSADGRSPPRWNALLGQSFTNAGPGK